ncbi:LLM class flavin-dependent oxidoreductase [Marinactinospora rubrisoli]|uniref:LLM class flavin-dependent oxidoreductase n=1 Tax=Marinactinospora rubrisoli TaxID=2715399 RepID=A0ABW2KE98_9ACTN
MPRPKVGFTFPCRLPLSGLPPIAREVERAGFDELWVVEDCFLAGGIATTATALAVTERITVGLGILPAVARNAAFTAMELAALAEAHPGRLIAGLGHGVPAWMRQIGAAPASPLTALAEHLDAVRRLLAGETVTTQGRYVRLDGVALDFPPAVPPPVVAGVRGPKSLRVSGRYADGTHLAEPASPEYIAAARRSIETGRTGQERPHRIDVNAWLHVDDDADRARAALRPTVAAAVTDPALAAHIEALDFAADARELARLPEAERVAAVPDAWVDALAVVGTPRDCARRITELHEAGAESVILYPPGDVTEQLSRAAGQVLPLLRG